MWLRRNTPPADVPRSMKGYTIEREIARGAQGIVHRARDQDGNEVVLKECSLRDGKHERTVLDAISAANGGAARHVVRCIDGFQSGRHYFIVEEALRTTLDQAFRPGAISPFALMHLGVDTSKAIEEIARAGIVHCDLKPDNFAVSATAQRIVLIDFGTAVPVGSRTRGYTQHLAAPEVQQGRPCETSDVCGWGRLIEFELTGLVGITPRRALTDVVPWVGRRFAEIVSECCREDPGRRPVPVELAEAVRDALSQTRSCPGCGTVQFEDAPAAYPCCTTAITGSPGTRRAAYAGAVVA